MSNICCVLDACTVINLIHIDEDDFLLKKIEKLDLHINDLVFDEIKKNVYKKIEVNRNSKYSNKKAIEEERKIIDQKLTFFRSKKNDNSKLLYDLGDDFFERIGKLSNYSKVNGELYSAAYSLYLSRFNLKKIFFYTDDYPAKSQFSDFFDYQQIGQIKDTVDLLTLLYWLDDTFTENQLDNKLSELYSEYATEVSLLKDELQIFYKSKVDAQFLKTKKDVAENLRELIAKLNRLNFDNINCNLPLTSYIQN